MFTQVEIPQYVPTNGSVVHAPFTELSLSAFETELSLYNIQLKLNGLSRREIQSYPANELLPDATIDVQAAGNMGLSYIMAVNDNPSYWYQRPNDWVRIDYERHGVYGRMVKAAKIKVISEINTAFMKEHWAPSEIDSAPPRTCSVDVLQSALSCYENNCGSGASFSSSAVHCVIENCMAVIDPCSSKLPCLVAALESSVALGKPASSAFDAAVACIGTCPQRFTAGLLPSSELPVGTWRVLHPGGRTGCTNGNFAFAIKIGTSGNVVLSFQGGENNV
jgi:hypothetical protein